MILSASVDYPCDRVAPLGAVVAAAGQQHESSPRHTTGLEQIQFQVWFLLNAYHPCTIIK